MKYLRELAIEILGEDIGSRWFRAIAHQYISYPDRIQTDFVVLRNELCAYQETQIAVNIRFNDIIGRVYWAGSYEGFDFWSNKLR